MLLKAGMTIKQAFMCNLLSAALQLIGVILGVSMGAGMDSACEWLFAFAAGIFLYVALVDMVSAWLLLPHTLPNIDRYNMG